MTSLVLQASGKLQAWQHDLPTPSTLLSEIKERQYFWKQGTPNLPLPGNLMECIKCADGRGVGGGGLGGVGNK